MLGQYQVESLIGVGGMASVYRAMHRTIGKAVAIKVLDRALLVPDAVERFLMEAQATSRIDHEHVIDITDFGQTSDGVVFSVMELLVGETLQATLDAEGTLEPRRAAAIMLQICGALSAAHDAGIVHRDLKPENCFRTPRTSNADYIKVLDFGIAKVKRSAEQRITATPRRTRVGVIVGTPEFMAPEQARAEDCDHRADVYSAGVMFFRMLTGRMPFEKSSAAELLAQHMYEPVPAMQGIRPSLPSALCAVVDCAMAKEPSARYDSMAAMAEAIEDALADTTEPAAVGVSMPDIVTSTAVVGATRGSRWRGWSAAGIAAALLLGWWSWSSDREAAPAAQRDAGESELEAVVDVEAESDVQAEARAQPESEPEFDLGVEPGVELGVEPQAAAPEADDEATLEPEVAPVPEPKPEPEAKPRSKPRAPKKAPKAAVAPAAPPPVQGGKISEVKNPFAE